MPDSNENSQDPEHTTPAPEAAGETPQPTPDVQATEVDPPVVEAPAIEAPAIEAPAVDAPAVDAPAVEALAVEPSGVDASTIEAPTEQAPAAEAVTDDFPVMADSFSPEDLDSFSSEDLDLGEMDEFDEEPVDLPPPPPSEDLLNIASEEIPSFRALRDARSLVFETKSNLEAFQNRVEALGESGEEGRRRGLGAWVLGDYASSTTLLASFESDPVASFTRAKALMSQCNYAEAQKVYGRLAEEYPDLAPPRAGLIESRFLEALGKGDEETALSELENALANAPAEFADSPEGNYLAGRRAELAHDLELALDHYQAAKAADPSLRENLFRGAYLAERCGLDQMALEFYELLIRQLPIDANVLMNLGVLYEDMGRDQEAAACYDIVHRSKPTENRVRLYLNDAIAAMDMYYDEDRERKEDRLNQILRIPITDFELSVRARNCLNKMDINVLGDLVRRTEQELLSFKNFGETSLTEIKEILHSKGLRLGMPRDEAVASVEVHSTRTYTGEKADIYNKPISHLQLSIRARRTVEALGCLTIGDIMKHSSDELLGMPNFGITSLQELKGALSQISLKLRGE